MSNAGEFDITIIIFIQSIKYLFICRVIFEWIHMLNDRKKKRKNIFSFKNKIQS